VAERGGPFPEPQPSCTTVEGMRLGVFGINAGSTCGPAETIRLARLAEELGFDSVWAGEHVVAPSPRVPPSPIEPTDPILDPLVHLSFLAAATERLLLATGIIILPQRNPVVLAKQAASLDVLSGGRLMLGIGAGYLEPEMTAVGVPFSDRGARTDDYIAAMRVLWNAPGPVAYDGPFVSFANVDAHPRPVQSGGPKLVVGGHTAPAYRRAVACGHGWYGFALTPEAAAGCVDGLRRAAAQVHRPAELGQLEISVTPRRRLDPESVEGFAKAGVDRLVPNTIGLPSPEVVESRLRDAAEIVFRERPNT
jgi:probable F420-dependent oxidoreductase